ADAEGEQASEREERERHTHVHHADQLVIGGGQQVEELSAEARRPFLLEPRRHRGGRCRGGLGAHSLSPSLTAALSSEERGPASSCLSRMLLSLSLRFRPTPS